MFSDMVNQRNMEDFRRNENSIKGKMIKVEKLSEDKRIKSG